jgi:hypothetical protein
MASLELGLSSVGSARSQVEANCYRLIVAQRQIRNRGDSDRKCATCKSRACPSCGHRATLLWQRELWASLPDIRYAGIVFTMPNVLWPIFQRNRHLLHDLPALGAAVIKQWVKIKFGVEFLITVIPHTFGAWLNFNSHLHILVSAGGLKTSGKLGRSPVFWQKKADAHVAVCRAHFPETGVKGGRTEVRLKAGRPPSASSRSIQMVERSCGLLSIQDSLPAICRALRSSPSYRAASI